MASGYAVKQAADLMDAAFLARWTDREAIGPLARRALGVIIRRLAAGEGALPVTGLFPDLAPGEVADAIAELDHHDLVLVEAGALVLAYPFSPRPHPLPLEPGDRPPPFPGRPAGAFPDWRDCEINGDARGPRPARARGPRRGGRARRARCAAH